MFELNNANENTTLDLSDLLFGEPMEGDITSKLAELKNISALSTLDETEEVVSLEVSDMKTCPICRHKIRKSYEHFLEHTLAEYGYVCDCCGLSSSYAYGNYETGIEDFFWSHSYNSEPTKEESEKVRRQQQLVLNMYRKIHIDNESLTEEEEDELDALALELRSEEERLMAIPF